MPHTHRLLVPLHTGLLEILEYKTISLTNLKLQDMTAENLSLARAQRMNRSSVGTYEDRTESHEQQFFVK